jgi:hypothetical protein
MQFVAFQLNGNLAQCLLAFKQLQAFFVRLSIHLNELFLQRCSNQAVLLALGRFHAFDLALVVPADLDELGFVLLQQSRDFLGVLLLEQSLGILKLNLVLSMFTPLKIFMVVLKVLHFLLG